MIKLFFKEFAKYSSLNVLGMLGLSCYILADTFFVAKGLGSDGLAALNLAIPVYSFIHGRRPYGRDRRGREIRCRKKPE